MFPRNPKESLALTFFFLSLLLLVGIENAYEWSPNLHRFAFEYGNIGAALAEGRGFSDPFATGTGPTAWMPPFYCWFMALIFSIFGVKTSASIGALLLAKLLGLTLGARLLMASARRLSGEVGGLAVLGLCWVVILGHHSWLTRQLFDHWLVMLLSGLILYALVTGRTPAIAVTGILGPLISPNLALGFGLAAVFQWRGERKRQNLLWGCLLFSAGAWCLRNWIVLGVPYPIKSNAAYEFYQANAWARGRLSNATLTRYHPSQPNTFTGRHYQKEGERQFCWHYSRLSQELWLEDPVQMLGYIAKRTWDVLVYVPRSENLYLSKPNLQPSDKHLLHQRKWIIAKPRCQIWLLVDEPESEVRAQLAQLGLNDPESALLSWQSGMRWIEKARNHWSQRCKSCLTGLLPTLAILYGLLRHRREMLPWAILYGAYFGPYILVSHYDRYQLSALMLQVWLVWFAFFNAPRKQGHACSEKPPSPGEHPERQPPGQWLQPLSPDVHEPDRVD